MGVYVLEKLYFLKDKYLVIGDICGLGFMIGIEIVNLDMGEGDGDVLFEILDLVLEKGVLFYFCGNVSEVICMVFLFIVIKE